MTTARFIALVKMPQFHPQHGTLYPVHPAVPADHGVMVLDGLPVVSQTTEFFSQRGIIGGHGPPSPKAPKFLAG